MSFSDKFLSANKYSLVAINILKIVMISATVVGTALLPFLSNFIEKEAFDIFKDLHFLTIKPKHPIMYLVDNLHIAYAFITAAMFIMHTGFILVSFVIHIIYHFEAIKVLVRNMEEGMRVGSFEKWLKSVSLEVNFLKR